jgi:hypothetical protein
MYKKQVYPGTTLFCKRHVLQTSPSHNHSQFIFLFLQFRHHTAVHRCRCSPQCSNALLPQNQHSHVVLLFLHALYPQRQRVSFPFPTAHRVPHHFHHCFFQRHQLQLALCQLVHVARQTLLFRIHAPRHKTTGMAFLDQLLLFACQPCHFLFDLGNLLVRVRPTHHRTLVRHAGHRLSKAHGAQRFVDVFRRHVDNDAGVPERRRTEREKKTQK